MQSILGKEHLSPESTKLKSMVLTVKYDGSKALLTSGTSYQTFVMDKTADVLWDRNLASYLTKKEIPYEILSGTFLFLHFGLKNQTGQISED